MGDKSYENSSDICRDTVICGIPWRSPQNKGQTTTFFIFHHSEQRPIARSHQGSLSHLEILPYPMYQGTWKTCHFEWGSEKERAVEWIQAKCKHPASWSIWWYLWYRCHRWKKTAYVFMIGSSERLTIQTICNREIESPRKTAPSSVQRNRAPEFAARNSQHV